MYTQIGIISSMITKEEVDNICQTMMNNLNSLGFIVEPVMLPAILPKHYYLLALKELAKDRKMNRESSKYYVFFRFEAPENVKGIGNLIAEIHRKNKNIPYLHRTFISNNMLKTQVQNLFKSKPFSKNLAMGA